VPALAGAASRSTHTQTVSGSSASPQLGRGGAALATPRSAGKPDAFTDLIRLRADQPYPVTLGRAWSAISRSPGEPYLRMVSRLHDAAGKPLWPGFRRIATTDRLAPLEEGLRSLGRPELATVVPAVIRGLLKDLGATGDTARTDRVFTDVLIMVSVP